MDDQGRSHRNYYRRMKRYFNDFWNVVNLLSYVLIIVALCVRHFHPSQKFTVARRVFSLSLLVMYLRFLEVFLIHRKLGPTLIMIKEMVNTYYSTLFMLLSRKYHDHYPPLISSHIVYNSKFYCIEAKAQKRYILSFFFLFSSRTFSVSSP